jgi:hypothetical protein
VIPSTALNADRAVLDRFFTGADPCARIHSRPASLAVPVRSLTVFCRDPWVTPAAVVADRSEEVPHDRHHRAIPRVALADPSRCHTRIEKVLPVTAIPVDFSRRLALSWVAELAPMSRAVCSKAQGVEQALRITTGLTPATTLRDRVAALGGHIELAGSRWSNHRPVLRVT